MAVGNNITRIALSATLAIMSIIVMSLSAKLVHDGKIWNDALKEYERLYNQRKNSFSTSSNSFSSSGSFGTGSSSFGTGTSSFGDDSSTLIKRDLYITYYGTTYVIYDAPVPAYAVDLAVSLLSLFASVTTVILAVLGSGFPALICVIVDSILTVLWLAALAYSAAAFSKAGLFKASLLDAFAVTQIPKAAFAFIILSWLVALVLTVLSALAFFKKDKATADAPQPPVAAYDPAAAPQEHYGIPQQNEKPQQPMSVPV